MVIVYNIYDSERINPTILPCIETLLAGISIGDIVGLAILNYKRASLIDPRDSDIRANLDISRAQTIDQIVS